MVHAGASTSCRLLSTRLAHPKYLLMTAYNEMAKFPPSAVPRSRTGWLHRRRTRHRGSLIVAARYDAS